MADGVELATAYIALKVDGDQVAPGVRKSFSGADRIAGEAGTRSGRRFSEGVGRGTRTLAKGIAGTLTAYSVGKFFKDANDEAREAQKVGGQTAAVLKSTGGAANIGAKGVAALSTKLSVKVGIDDEVIQSGENMLLTFRNIRNETGKGGKVFNRATRDATDFGVAMKMDTTKAALQLGKALNDPTKGYAKLQRAGVTFTDQQVKQIKTLQASGDILGAQKVILKEVEKEFGGSAAAQATAADKANVSLKNLEETVGTALLPTFDKAANFFTNKAAPAISGFVTGMQNGTGPGGEFADTLHTVFDGAKDIARIGGRVIGFFDSLPGPVKKSAAELAIAAGAIHKIKGLGKTLGVPALLGKTALGAAASRGPVPVFVTNASSMGLPAGAGAPGVPGKGSKVKGLPAGAAGASKFGVTGALVAGVSLGGAGNETQAVRGAAELKALDTQLAKLSFKDPAAGAAEFNKYLEKSSSSVGEMNKYLPKTAAALDKTYGSEHALNTMLQGTAMAAGVAGVGVHGFQKRLQSLPPGVQTKITTPGYQLANANIGALKRKYDLTPKQVRTLIQLRDEASAKMAAIRARLVALNGQHAEVIVRTRNIGGGAAPGGGAGGADGMTVPRLSVGGTVNGKLRPYGDKVFAHLAPGEEVISNRYGQADRNRALLKAINANRYSGGGTVASRASSVAVGSDGSLVVHLYDSNDLLLGTMQGVADDRYEANQALPR